MFTHQISKKPRMFTHQSLRKPAPSLIFRSPPVLRSCIYRSCSCFRLGCGFAAPAALGQRWRVAHKLHNPLQQQKIFIFLRKEEARSDLSEIAPSVLALPPAGIWDTRSKEKRPELPGLSPVCGHRLLSLYRRAFYPIGSKSQAWTWEHLM
jgi:hypothetical protein